MYSLSMQCQNICLSVIVYSQWQYQTLIEMQITKKQSRHVCVCVYICMYCIEGHK